MAHVEVKFRRMYIRNSAYFDDEIVFHVELAADQEMKYSVENILVGDLNVTVRRVDDY